MTLNLSERTGIITGRMRLATVDTYTSPNGEDKQWTTWHDIVMFGGFAETMAGYISPGDYVFVTGRLHSRLLKKPKRVVQEVVAKEIEIILKADEYKNPITPEVGDVGE